MIDGLAGAAIGAASAILLALLAWWRWWPKDRAETRQVDAATEQTLTDIARGLIEEVRQNYETRIRFLEARIEELERTVAVLRALEPEVADLRAKVRQLRDERDGYARWARSLEKQVRELGGHPVPLSRFIRSNEEDN